LQEESLVYIGKKGNTKKHKETHVKSIA